MSSRRIAVEQKEIDCYTMGGRRCTDKSLVEAPVHTDLGTFEYGDTVCDEHLPNSNSIESETMSQQILVS